MKSILIIVLLSVSQWTVADNLAQQTMQLCEKIKSCALAELDGQELPADMKAMVISSMDGICAAMSTEFNNDNIKEYEELGKQAQACMSSLSSMSCASLMDGENDTPACKELEKRAEAYE